MRVRLSLIVVLAALLSACDSFNGGANVNDLETRNAQLQGTIEGLGTPGATIAALQMTADRGMMLQAEMNSVQGTALAVQGTLTAYQLGNGSFVAQPTPPPAGVTPGAVASGPTPGGSQTMFSNTTTSSGVRDEDGCASAPSAVFEVYEDQIYVVTTITNLKAGSVLGARWLANGSLFFDDAQCWIPSEDWASVCAWCAITPDTDTFETGNWSVELLLDGQLYSQAQFQVVDSSQQAAPTEEFQVTPQQ